MNGKLQIQRPEILVKDSSSGDIVETLTSNVPDLIIATGSLTGSSFVAEGATFLARFRRGQPFKGEPAYVWTVNGEKGELRLVAPGGPSLQAGGYNAPVTIEVHDFATDEVTPIEWEWPEWELEFQVPARSIAALYEAFAEGDDTKYPTFDDALRLHEQLEGLLRGFVGTT